MNRHQEQQIAISDYREFRPPSALAEYLLCFWTQTISPSSEFTQRVLPDCCVDILLMNGVPMLIGPWTEPFDANLPPGTKCARRTLPSRTCIEPAGRACVGTAQSVRATL